MRQLLSCSLLIGLIVGSALPAAAAKRVALVIGNSAYQNAEPLPNPVNDSRAVADALRRLDFVVIEAEDEDKAGMQTVLRQFIGELEGADASLFFYAGHGLQVQGQNYLVPVDAALESEVDLPFEALAVDVVLDLMEQTTPTRLVFLDACRDNPLARRLSRAVGKSRSIGIGRGLARMNNRVGTLIAFATEPDKVALDGEGEHSPFTRALLKHIETPGIEVRQMLSRVRATVIDNTDGEQLPLDTSALVDDFYFAPPDPEPEPPVAATPAVATPAVPGSLSTEHLFWQSIQTSSNADDFEAYLTSYPDGAFASLARNRLNVLSSAEETEVAALRPTETPIETPAETPQAAPTPSPGPATAPGPAPAPVVEIEVEPLDATVVATRNVNVRGAPNTDGEPFAVVAQGAEVAVVGKVVGANWYRIRRPDGSEAYVYAPLFVSPEELIAQAAAEPAPAPTEPPAPVTAPAPVATAAVAPSPQTSAEAPAEPVRMAAVVPNVETPMTRTGAMSAPMVDTRALLQAIGKRNRNSTLTFKYRLMGEQSRDFVAFDRWEDAGSTDGAPLWSFAEAGGTRVQSSSETFGQAMLASQVGDELFGVLMSSHATHGGRATFMSGSAESALGQWAFLDQHGARVQGTSSLVFDGVQFEVAALALNPGAPAESCLGFVGIQVNKRVDGFVCRLQGPAFQLADANAVLSQMTVPRLIEP